MKNYIICGIDAHEKTLVTRIAFNRENPMTRTFKHNDDGVRELLKTLDKMRHKQGKAQIVMAYEASSLGFGLFDTLHAKRRICHVLAPHKIRQSAEDKKRKNDVRDAQRVLEQLKNHYLAGNELPAVWVPDPKTRADRQLVRARLEMGNRITQLKTQIQTFLKVNSLTVSYSTQNTWTRSYRLGLERLTRPGGGLPKPLRTVLTSHWRLLSQLEAEQVILDQAIVELSEQPRYQAAVNAMVAEFIGVGLLTAMVFLTELGDLRRFKNRRQIGAYLGLCPSSFESGETDDRKGHITRQGSARVRKVLCQSVWTRCRFDATEEKTYRRLVNRNPKKKKVAVVACMRRLGVRMWHVARAVQPDDFDPSFRPALT